MNFRWQGFIFKHGAKLTTAAGSSTLVSAEASTTAGVASAGLTSSTGTATVGSGADIIEIRDVSCHTLSKKERYI